MRNLWFYLFGGAVVLLLVAGVIVVYYVLGYLVLAICGVGPGDLYYNSSVAFFMGGAVVTAAIGIAAVCLVAGEIRAAIKAPREKGEEEKDED